MASERPQYGRTNVEISWGYEDDGGNSSSMGHVTHAPGLNVRTALIAFAKECAEAHPNERGTNYRNMLDVMQIAHVYPDLFAKHGLFIPEEPDAHYVRIAEYPKELGGDGDGYEEDQWGYDSSSTESADLVIVSHDDPDYENE